MPTHKATLLNSPSTWLCYVNERVFSGELVLFTHPQAVGTQGDCKKSEEGQTVS